MTKIYYIIKELSNNKNITQFNIEAMESEFKCIVFLESTSENTMENSLFIIKILQEKDIIKEEFLRIEEIKN